ncbi:NmrA family transcriptional regulator [Streptomyces sp. NPDC088354]|uniref:NmrA family transcriptional regulator n=1 Tax=Streptomyces sp. NPDC088354 TaxID=3365856 RepID=UPI0037FFECCC
MVGSLGSLTQTRTPLPQGTALVLGGTGKTGRHVVRAPAARGLAVRTASRSGEPPFGWADRATWAPVLDGATVAYLACHPDIGDSGAAATLGALASPAAASGVRRIALLSARGEDLARPAEDAVRGAGADCTVIRASWFCQNFSEGLFRDGVLDGGIVFPAGTVGEPFVDARDIADLAVAALTGDGHAGRVYEATGPRLLTFADAAAEIGAATGRPGRPVRYTAVPPRAYAPHLTALGLPDETVGFLVQLFGDLLDGRNALLTDDVERVLGRTPRDFRDFAHEAAAAGAWHH